MFRAFWFNCLPSHIGIMQSITIPIKDRSKIPYTTPMKCQIGNICSMDTYVVTFLQDALKHFVNHFPITMMKQQKLNTHQENFI